MMARRHFLIAILLIVDGIPQGGGPFGPVAWAAGNTVKDMLAAQIRTQGVACEQPKRAIRDAKRSKPDYEVWVLQCSNATYRISRYPDMAAKVEQLK
ncbi:hypothetical protein Q3C01_43120 [Bradyrhizobium sp. UFLA05-109]